MELGCFGGLLFKFQSQYFGGLSVLAYCIAKHCDHDCLLSVHYTVSHSWPNKLRVAKRTELLRGKV